ncbi:GFA family protein [Bradyrhizobium murdochi]|uniref:GFA family protein n=1 Tax=Bradyrhizobium murdochi TaxID=1038859 RepID=UPI0004216322|nr:GFA family protein [Bradyrhizobium murdochi]
MTKNLAGGCLCGAVRYSAQAEPMMVGNCYCTDCRKASGTSHGTHAAIPDSAFSLAGETKAFERAADSGNIVIRAFCPTCGCAIFSRNTGIPGMTFIRVSSLDDPDQVEPQITVYASRAPAWAPLDRSKPVFDLMPEGGPGAVLADG